MIWGSYASLAQPTLPDLTGNGEKGLVLLSWICQYDGVKSIAVLRSADSSFNYSTVGYVKKLYKGVQAFADGHPMPGRNYYRLSIVFNSGLTWNSNHYGVYVDSAVLRNARLMPSNEALQKLIVTEQTDKVAKTEIPQPRKYPAPADRDKYMEVLRKDTAPELPPLKPKLNITNNDGDNLDISSYIETLQDETQKKISITYQSDVEEIDPTAYLDEDKSNTTKTPDQKKKVNVTFDDAKDIPAFVESLPKSPGRKITVSYTPDSGDLDSKAYLKEEEEEDKPQKKISLTFKDEAEVHAYIETLPKLSHSKITLSYSVDSGDIRSKAKPLAINPLSAFTTTEPPKPPEESPRPKISIRLKDEPIVNSANDIKSKIIFSDPSNGHVRMNLPDDVKTRHYSIKFYDNENHMVIEIPRINSMKIILDKRNFQKKGLYKFVLRKDGLELEAGYINIY